MKPCKICIFQPFKHLISQLKSGNRFRCELSEKKSGAFKLVKWIKPTFVSSLDHVRQFTFGDIEVFEPNLISLRRVNKSLLAKIVSNSCSRSGFVSEDWVLWYLSQMRDNSIVHLIIQNGKFSNGHCVNQGNFGPSCINFSHHPQYGTRTIRTYLDNETNFFFA